MACTKWISSEPAAEAPGAKAASAPDRGAWSGATFGPGARPVDVGLLFPVVRDDAGRLPRIRARGDRLVGQDGAPVRFFGTNLTANALFSTPEAAVKREARRLAAFGFNLVRLHHHDSVWVDPNVFGSRPIQTRTADPEQLEKIDVWIRHLNEAGIYVWLDLHVGRVFTEADGITAYAELADLDFTGRGACYVNPSLERRMHAFAEQYLDRKNVHTGERVATAPGILAVLFTNENDLVAHFSVALEREGHPRHHRMFLEAAEPIVDRLKLSDPRKLDLWELGPAKRLLSELEQAFLRRYDEYLDRLGVESLRAATQGWGEAPAYILPSMKVGSLLDVHSYGEADALRADPRTKANFVHHMGAYQTLDRPLAISEWNMPHPAPHRFGAPLYVAAIASLQGWDAPMAYAWTQGDPSRPEQLGPWEIHTDPALAATLPAAAVLFRRGDVRPSPNHHVVQLTDASLYGAHTGPKTSRTLRTLVERSRLSVRLPGSSAPIPEGARVVEDLDVDFIPSGGSIVRSDTGELARDWQRGLFTIDTPRSQAAVGGVGGPPIELSTFRIESRTEHAALAFTSMDSEPLDRSADILVTAVARAEVVDGRLPFRAEPVVATFRIARSEPLHLVPLLPDGTEAPAVDPVRREDGTQTFAVPEAPPTHWYRLRPIPSDGR